MNNKIDDKSILEIHFSPICSFCIHLDSKSYNACRAFPNEGEIPLEIWDGSNNHTTSYPGDNGIMFERVPIAASGTDSYPLHEPKQNTPFMHSEPDKSNTFLCYLCGQILMPDSNTIFSEKINLSIKSKSIDILCPTCAVTHIKSIHPALPTDFIHHFAEKYTTSHNHIFFRFGESSFVSNLRSLASDLGGKSGMPTYFPDGSGFFCMSLPLPKGHWLLQPGHNMPPMPFRPGKDHPLRKIFENALNDAGRYAVRVSTANGTEMDFDPDAMVQNFIIGLLGPHTTTGLSTDHENNPS